MRLVKARHLIKIPSFSLTSIMYCVHTSFQIATMWLESGFTANKHEADVLQSKTSDSWEC